MEKIIVLDKMPVVLTKDASYMESIKGAVPVKNGTIVQLPQDATLVYDERIKE